MISIRSKSEIRWSRQLFRSTNCETQKGKTNYLRHLAESSTDRNGPQFFPSTIHFEGCLSHVSLLSTHSFSLASLSIPSPISFKAKMIECLTSQSPKSTAPDRQTSALSLPASSLRTLYLLLFLFWVWFGLDGPGQWCLVLVYRFGRSSLWFLAIRKCRAGSSCHVVK